MKKNIYFILILLLGFSSCSAQKQLSDSDTHPIIFPVPFAFAIDDIGWNDGHDAGATTEGPYRIGLKRHLDITDYKCIVDVAKRTGIRFQGLFILGEMDRHNILKKYPTTNEFGKDWDNSKNVNDEQIEIMNYVKENAAWLEFGLHGVGHEYWPVEAGGVRKRAEWYCTTDNHPWPEEQIDKHIACFKELMAQYGLSEEEGHSFPESFVPCAYGYYWNPDGDYSTGSKLGAAGVKYTNTLFYPYIEELNPPKGENAGALDHGVLVINRINYGNPWYELASLPTVPLEDQKSNIIESHWTNWLVQDEFLQSDLNQKWVDYFKYVGQSKDRYPAKNTEQFYAQWVYQKFTKITQKGNTVYIDNTLLPDEYYQNDLVGNLVLKVKLNDGEHVSFARLDRKDINVYFEKEGYGYLVLPRLEKKKYKLKVDIAHKTMNTYVKNDGTYNIYDFTNTKNKAKLTLRMYGTQKMEIIGIDKPRNFTSSNPMLKILHSQYDEKSNTLELEIAAHDIQGETGEISWDY